LQECFSGIEKEINRSTYCPTPNLSVPFEFMCDTLDYALGVVLVQRINRFPHEISYSSQMIDATQCHYTTTEKELLAIVFALDKF